MPKATKEIVLIGCGENHLPGRKYIVAIVDIVSRTDIKSHELLQECREIVHGESSLSGCKFTSEDRISLVRKRPNGVTTELGNSMYKRQHKRHKIHVELLHTMVCAEKYIEAGSIVETNAMVRPQVPSNDFSCSFVDTYSTYSTSMGWNTSLNR